MSTTNSARIYYLAPAAPAQVAPRRLPATLRLRLQLRIAWWRLRLTVDDVARALRRFGRPEPDTDTVILEQHADLVVAGGARADIGPARIIDLAAARTRLR